MRYEVITLSSKNTLLVGSGKQVVLEYSSSRDGSAVVVKFSDTEIVALADNAEDGQTIELEQPFVYVLHGDDLCHWRIVGGLFATLIKDDDIVERLALERDRKLEEFWDLKMFIHHQFFVCVHETRIIVFNADLSVRWSRFKQLIDHFAVIDNKCIVFLTDHEMRWLVSLDDGVTVVDESGIHADLPQI